MLTRRSRFDLECGVAEYADGGYCLQLRRLTGIALVPEKGSIFMSKTVTTVPDETKKLATQGHCLAGAGRAKQHQDGA